MLRAFFAFLLSFIASIAYGQQYSMALGLYSGITVPYTMDRGIDNDSRYKARYTIKAAPIGLAYSVDSQKLGFQISPGLYTIGQSYYIVNTAGGQDGRRNIDLQYILLPVAVRFHLIDLSFFRVSAVASASGGFLINAKDELSHDYTKLKFPSQTYSILPPDYVQEYDGIVSPAINKAEISKQEDYKSVQIFGGLGLSSDWNVTESWRLTFDFRVNYGVLDSRSNDYLDRIKNYQSIYDVPGKRTETFAHISICVSRYLDFDKADRDRAKNLKGSRKKFKPRKIVPRPR